MTDFRLVLPDDFDRYAWELESKGWFADAVVEFGGSSFPVTFYDPVRLAQDIELEFRERPLFFEPNVVIVERVSKEVMERAVEYLAKSGGLARLAGFERERRER